MSEWLRILRCVLFHVPQWTVDAIEHHVEFSYFDGPWDEIDMRCRVCQRTWKKNWP